MGRPKDPLTPYRMRTLKGGKDGSITYAVTYPGGRSVNGRRSSNIAFWGHLTEGLCFEPMLRFQLLPDSEKRKYIFPPEWDISRAFETVYTRKEPGVVHDGDDMIRIYGDALLLDRLADRYGVKEDLTAVFGGETAGKIISIACYLILVDKTLVHYESVARVRWFPCTEGLGAASITLLSQSITQEQIDRFRQLRVARAGEGCQWFGVDSTSITSYAKGIGDVTWGHNKEGDKARQLNMMVVYSFTSGLPAHYMKLAGGLPDSRSLRLLREELLSAGTPPAGYIFDRAYLTDEDLDYVVPMGLKCIFMARYDRNVIKEAIADAGRDERIIREGEFIKDEECYAMEYVFPYSYKEEGSGPGRGESLPQRLVVIFRPDVKGEETIAVSKYIADLCASAEGHMKDGVPVDDALRRRYARYLDASYDEAGRIAERIMALGGSLRKVRLPRLRVLQHAEGRIPGQRGAALVLQARCAGEDLLLHEELAAGQKAEGIHRGQRHWTALHPLRRPDVELRPPCGVRKVTVAEGELSVAMGCARQPDVHPPA